ncbi:MAG: hypothetical protein K6E91_05495 [Butyrivibrio sp.]|nr:hypothetical protein [Butyrivibrio sp.]
MLFWRDGKWCPSRAKNAFRFFTVQSNVLCAAAALCMLLFRDAEWTYYLKIIGTAAVTVTMMTVLLFLGPSFGYRYMFKGSDLFMHLLTPLLALVSLCVFERRGLSFAASFIGMTHVVLYAPLYLYKILYAPEGKRWDDFYGFNRGGNWKISYVLMHIGTALICIAMYFALRGNY